jgi:hypothetical protein
VIGLIDSWLLVDAVAVVSIKLKFKPLTLISHTQQDAKTQDYGGGGNGFIL